MYQFSKYPYSYFSYGFDFYLRVYFFPVNILKNTLLNHSMMLVKDDFRVLHNDDVLFTFYLSHGLPELG